MKKILPIIIIIASIASINHIVNNPPKSKRGKSSKKNKISVKTLKVNAKSFTPYLESFGYAQPSVKTKVLSQVSGKVIYLSDNFKDGSTFKKGELLVKVEDIEYQANEKIAQSKLILAQQKLLEAKAYTKQAEFEWGNQGNNTKPSDLVLKLPQLRSAQTDLLAAEAELQKAKLILSRTEIYAPYDGRVIDTDLTVSQVISNNALLANIYASNQIEISLPIKNKDLPLFDFDNIGSVVLKSHLSNSVFTGQIVRTQSLLDEQSKQLYCIALITPHSKLHVGEFLSAKIKVSPIKNAIVIPSEAIYQGQFVYIEKNNIIRKKDIEIAWSDSNHSIVSSGLHNNDSIILTKLGAVSSGTAVKVVNKATGVK
ncbi:MAG: efflux RND transporter periplasmic adaptor subunit [Candidatus Cloacimonetes bacterium]|nr:efflux RND transporter periplasmic adaptor subunit [Candidatus Cloacimonadota bacterium]